MGRTAGGLLSISLLLAGPAQADNAKLAARSVPASSAVTAPGAAAAAAFHDAHNGFVRARITATKPAGEANPTPVFRGSCADLSLHLVSGGGTQVVVVGTGSLQNGYCDLASAVAPGAVTATVLASKIPGFSSRPLLTKPFSVLAGGQEDLARTVEWPIEPTAVVEGGMLLDGMGVTGDVCPDITVTVVHPQRTFVGKATKENAHTCSFFFNWVPPGVVTISVSKSGWTDPGPFLPKTGTVALGVALNVGLARR